MNSLGFAFHTVSVAPEQAGERLDKLLAAALPDLSRSRLKDLITDGLVSDASGARWSEPSRKVRGGERLTVAVPAAVPATPEAQEIALVVVYEDDDLIVVDKPAGMVVHPAPGSPDATLVNALLAHCGGSLSGIGGVRRPGIVHRLDKDTSGLIVAAKNDRAHHGLAEQFAAHAIDRAYRAVVWGVPMPRRGEIEGNIGRSPTNRKKMAIVNHGGKTALTRYEVVQAFGDAAAVVECRLATGRTHQIRVHMTAQGHPLIGDATYGRNGTAVRRLPPAVRPAVMAFDRQALHAYRIGFLHPRTGQKLQFSSDIPNDIKRLIITLEQL